MTRRLAAVLALAVVVAAGLAGHRLMPSSVASDVAGDALYAVAVYTGLVLLLPRARPLLLAAGAAAWCVAVELLQLTVLPITLAERMPVAALVLGSGFDARDLVVYVLAVVSALGVDGVVTRVRARRAETG
ncbi:DUF2809 domain-containing protein [Microbacterium sp. KSW4-17]|uniref:DUF2809 domain-containing protein n=1 Tax=Microbacterium galbum TaxID=3075994 RepID=A0ABU3T2V1_9MICO|nr:DUF2809 domain-containing protein [Microbacterium sp. KSW4-17]MDU0365699.1 DUF2809 domain-containing protein [Microbacterium sp. KSW4-17]